MHCRCRSFSVTAGEPCPTLPLKLSATLTPLTLGSSLTPPNPALGGMGSGARVVPAVEVGKAVEDEAEEEGGLVGSWVATHYQFQASGGAATSIPIR